MGALDNLFFPRIDSDGTRVIDSPRSFNFIGGTVTDDPINGRADIDVGGGFRAFPRNVVESDTVALFTGDNTLTDIGPSAFVLQALAGSVRYTQIIPGFRGFSLRSGDRLQSVLTNTAMALTGAMTVEFILLSYRTTNNSANRIVYHGTDTIGTSTTNCAWITDLHNTTNDIVWSQMSGSAVFSTQTWNGDTVPALSYVAFTRTAGQVVTPYLQGVTAGAPSSALTTPQVGASGRLIIGGPTHYEFAIADIRISNTAHTATQIKATYNATLGKILGRQP